MSPTRVPAGQRARLAARAVGQAGGLLGALGVVPDRRKARGRRYGLASVLALWFTGVLAGQQTFTAVWEWAVELPAELLAGFGLSRGVPSERTIRRLVEGCDPAGLDAALSGWIARAVAVADPPSGPRGLAFDGKTLKGARSFTQAGAMIQEAVVEAVWHDTGVAAGHQRVVGGDEIAAVEALAGRLDLTDVLVTADSLHSHERLARKIRARGGHWLLVIKLNQPTVHANLTRLPWGQAPDLVTTVEKAHGRIEARSLKALTVTTPKLVGFWGTKQVVELRRRTRRKKTVTSKPALSEEVFYLVTSLPAEQAHPRDLAARARGHWTVEAVHHVRDRVLDEDRHTVRTGNAPLAWAIARDTAISALRLTGHRSIAKALRATARQPERVLQIIGLISEKGL
ncbi:ISAs1 family transposase [Pseudofrankia sp. BMG5.37]|uniref:ISAs1 family transposase n=2 Tax=Pseudofrankia sp. BMG5.37 TaxID=3050035 RepID=UPI00289525A4|nr:ISAs1 family transposase [Pseudofrankia sp. BMG5.37]MDT3446694.1 ISAs1 family transposase [Pseudofrankia sp. BMG5.37]MDT3446705.1 ISAs1 family transposase [Pseudofrankia sp. BMG5.37]